MIGPVSPLEKLMQGFTVLSFLHLIFNASDELERCLEHEHFWGVGL